jgi:hypothetical protein
MSELSMMEAALFQLRSALGNDPDLLPIRLSTDVLGNAVAAAKAGGVNAARVNDIEFALSDLISAVDDATSTPDEIYAAIALLQNDAAALRAANALPPEVPAAMRALQVKLRERAKALERSQYRAEGTEPGPLPHPPDELREAAVPIARQLEAAGFMTPALDELIARPQETRYHSLNEISDEFDAILGG